MELKVRFKLEDYAAGDMVVSTIADSGSQTPYEIDCFFCWPDKTEVHLKHNKHHWNLKHIEKYDPTKHKFKN